MSEDTIEEIKSRLDIVDIIKEYVELEKVGSNLRALCPFHAEKTPSFFVSPTRQSWRCFGGCNDGGDMFDFVMKIEGVEFPEALRILAKKAGVEIKRTNPETVTEKENFYKLYQLATKFFERQLEASKRGKKAKQYILDRGISEEAINNWRLGYSPDSWQSLSEFLISKGFKRDKIIDSGLAIKKDDHSYDRFRGRIMFPIMNTSGRPIAFGGRIFGDSEDTAKYMNSPQTLLYDKSKVLYGIDKAKVEIRRQNKAILVEGYTDVIMAHQAGFKNVVSTSGTALTKKQLNILSRYSQNLFTCFDMDNAGISATKKGIEMARALGFDVQVITLPSGDDPADLIKKDSDQWKKRVKEAKDAMQFYFEAACEGKDLDNPKDKKDIAKELLPLIKKMPNNIEKSHWAKKLAKKLDVPEEAIYNQLRKTKVENDNKKKTKRRSKKKPKKRIKTKKRILEERVISILAKKPDLINVLEERDLFSKKAEELIKAIEDNNSEYKEKIDYYALKPENGMENPEEELQECLIEIDKYNLKNKLKDIHKKIQKAEKEKDKKELKKHTEEAYNLSKKLQKYND
jgi:DNA primase